MHHFRSTIKSYFIFLMLDFFFAQPIKSMMNSGKLVGNKFDDDYRPIDNDPEVNCSQTHQVGIHSEYIHHGQRKEQAQWNNRCNH